MKKNTFLILSSLLISTLSNAQVVYSENFDNFTLGDVAADYFGQTPGQGGWYTLKGTLNSSAANFQIENETSKGKVLIIKTGPLGDNGGTTMFKKGFDIIWGQRTPGNNVLKFEIDFYTANYPTNPSNNLVINSGIGIYGKNNKFLASYGYFHSNGELTGYRFNGFTGVYKSLGTNGSLYLNKGQWYKMVFYIDYDNEKVYFEIPALGIVIKTDATNTATPTDVISNYPIVDLYLTIGKQENQNQPSLSKFDNIKITALKNVPLSVSEFLNDKFTIYPNPATNVVNITNTENIQVSTITIYDVTGKLLSTQSFNNETNIQLNTEGLASGTYMLHLQTNKGVAVKKIIKK